MLTQHIKKIIIIGFSLGFSLALAACGGGGGGGSTSPPSTRPTGDITFPFDSTQGTPSTYINALTSFKENYLDLLSDTFSSSHQTALRFRTPTQYGEFLDNGAVQVTSDTNAQNAWRQGWTGKGVKVGHLDDFQTEDISFTASVPFNRESHGNLTRVVTFLVAPEIDHSAQQLTFGCNVADHVQEGQINEAYAHFEAQGYHIVNNSFGADRYDDGRCSRRPQLAPIGAWNDTINIYSQDTVFLSYANPSGETETYDRNMLFIFAAGNAAQGCTLGTAECNLYAASIEKLRNDGKTEAGDRVMFVGALTNNSTQLAGYSHAAGEEMKYDYIVAHADIITNRDVAGTSFAAPRVTGAAALVRHKFPNLDGAALKQVLLQTADDLGAPGTDNVFGYGQLNVLNALSPIGRVTMD